MFFFWYKSSTWIKIGITSWIFGQISLKVTGKLNPKIETLCTMYYKTVWVLLNDLQTDPVVVLIILDFHQVELAVYHLIINDNVVLFFFSLIIKFSRIKISPEDVFYAWFVPFYSLNELFKRFLVHLVEIIQVNEEFLNFNSGNDDWICKRRS